MNKCITCGKDCEKKYCNSNCYFNRGSKSNHRHSPETRQKIRIANTGKVFSKKRRENISKANTKKVSQEKIDELKKLWKLRYVNPTVIQNITGLSRRVYDRLKKEHCEYEQIKFMPSDMYPEELATIDKMGEQNIYYKYIAKKMNRGHKQIYSVLLKMGHEPVTINPDAYKGEPSKLELDVVNDLVSEGIDLETQWHFENFYFDIKIKKMNLVIEVHGDYWHCNPKIYKDGPINDMQRSAIRRDFCKRDKIQAAGFKRIIIWENDYRTNPSETIEKVVQKIRRHSEQFNNG